MTENIRICFQNAERQVGIFSQLVQWTPFLLVVQIFVFENL